MDIATHISTLTITEGQGAGEPMTVLPWQTDFLQGAFAPDVQSAALSIARGNGKTTLLAAIAHAALCGPLARPRGQVIFVASSFAQARIGFSHLLAFLQDAPTRQFRITDNPQNAEVTNRENGAKVRCIASDPRRAHGLAPSLIIADEPAQWPPSTSDRMEAALATSMGKIPGSRMVSIGTRPAEPGHWFSQLLDGEADYVQVHAAPDTADPQDPATWAAANPSLPHMPYLEKAIAREAELAILDPGSMAAFRALRLNQGTHDTARQSLLDAGVWENAEGEAPADGPVVWGVDLGTTAAMSAVAAYWPQTGRLDALAAFPEEPNIAERARRDSVGPLYQSMADRGELITAGDCAVNVADLLREALARFGRPVAVAADRWREGELREALTLAGVPRASLVSRGQGYKDGGEDVRLFRRAILEGLVTPTKSLLLRAALAEATTITDPAGNAKLAKGTEGGRRFRARDDAAAAAIIAVAEGYRNRPTEAPAPRRLVIV